MPKKTCPDCNYVWLSEMEGVGCPPCKKMNESWEPLSSECYDGKVFISDEKKRRMKDCLRPVLDY